MTSTLPDALRSLADDLEKELALSWQGREQAWLATLSRALSRIDGALFRHATPSEEKLLEPMETTAQRDLSPGLARQAQALQDRHADVAGRVNALLAKVRPSAADDDLESLRRTGTDLVEALRSFREVENKLVLEAALRDTGAGD